MTRLFTATLAVASAVLLTATVADAREPPKELRIGVKHKPTSCPIKTQKGDQLSMHYTGKLWEGEKFDSSLDRGDPFEFTLGAGQVIPGWDKGLLDMCEGEKRKLQIPAKLGYGDRGAGAKIPGGSTLVFDVELLQIKGPRAKALKAAAPVVSAAGTAKEAVQENTKKGAEVVQENAKKGAEVVQENVKVGAETVQKTFNAGAETVQENVKAGTEAMKERAEKGAETVQENAKAAVEAVQEGAESVKKVVKETVDSVREEL
ncbi:unnamed protein product [Tilletia laevis]|uniref:peptidylprolyl isomerase n=2 Tax=Tilletia TaxID=13289 RepID=A0A177TZI9_9BASI|nr:hypothetical protein CF336_g6891 [Tilletia laevis]KAE8252398.1 hypothetical protein A4X03_0g6177 [Tilletia caries]CAD6920661.1 unnamed protein product [Tilletia controversa]KAE8187509.1 hypothetical protein CF335_g7150 [Tilletia laevis]CAD6892260.1 unnamed protein product [Tilletia caries]